MNTRTSNILRFLVAALVVGLYAIFLAPRMRINYELQDDDVFLLQLLSIFFFVLVVGFIGFRKSKKRRWLSAMVRLVSSVVITIAIMAGIITYPTIDTRFARAVEKGNERRVARILKNNPIRRNTGFMNHPRTPHLTHYDLEKAFHVALSQERWDIAQLLLWNGLDLKELRMDPGPLKIAVLEENLGLFNRLVSWGADPRQEAEKLLYATLPDKIKALRFLLRSGITHDTPMTDATLLHWLVSAIQRLEEGSTSADQAWEMVALLMEKGGDINAFSRLGHTPIMYVSKPQVQEKLIALGAQPVERDESGWTPLHHAVADQNIKQIRRIIREQPILLNVGDRNGTRPLHLAVDVDKYRSMLPIVQLLLEAGADPNVETTMHDLRPLQQAALERLLLPMFRLLLKHGADPSVKTELDEDILFTSHIMTDPEAVMLLLEHDVVFNTTFRNRAKRYASDEINAMIEERYNSGI
ncbi:MAG: ankyrin repeat domain-containing protein [Cytophagales bacterium]|nr:ankyrin repeat domain-containing protein [Cytophagales bacterium]